MKRNPSVFKRSARVRIRPRFFLMFFVLFGLLAAGCFLLANAQLARQIPPEKVIVGTGDPVTPIASERPDPVPGSETGDPSDPEAGGDDTPSGVTDVTLAQASVYVMIDPGHGGKDGGSYNGNLKESDLNLAIALYVRDILQSKGIGVLMTRDTDVMVGPGQREGLYTRATMCNKSNAVCLVSIHANAYANDTSVHGIDTYRNTTTNAKSEDLAAYVQNAAVKATGAKDRGLKSDAELVVIRETKVPSCLIEVGFITNPDEFKDLSDDAYRKKLAQGIAGGIIDFLLQENYVKEVTVTN
jgi:N-acetylmuramoyl-L-alanine amidase